MSLFLTDHIFGDLAPICCRLLTSACHVVLLLTSLASAQIQMNIVDDWTLEVGPGCQVYGKTKVEMTEPQSIHVEKEQKISVKGEVHIPETGCPWITPKGLIAYKKRSVEGCLIRDSLRISQTVDGTRIFREDKDYRVKRGTIQFIEGASVAVGFPMEISYEYRLNRLDGIFWTRQGQVKVSKGTPGLASLPCSVSEPGNVYLGGIWIPGETNELKKTNIFQVETRQRKDTHVSETVAERLLPKTTQRLRAGRHLSVVVLGDLATEAVTPSESDFYAQRFASELEHCFGITVDVNIEATKMPSPWNLLYTDKHILLEILNAKPDLAIIAFDCGLPLPGSLERQEQSPYHKVIKRLRENGTDVILLTKNPSHPCLFGTSRDQASLKFDHDTSMETQSVKWYGTKYRLALADVSDEWCTLWRMGIPYVIFLVDGKCEPDTRGHLIYCNTLLHVLDCGSRPYNPCAICEPHGDNN